MSWGPSPLQMSLGRLEGVVCAPHHHPRTRGRARVSAPCPASPAQLSAPLLPAADHLLHAAVGAGRHAEPGRVHPVLPERAAGEVPGGLREGEAGQGGEAVAQRIVPSCRAPRTWGAGGWALWWLLGESTGSGGPSWPSSSPGEGLVHLLPDLPGACACFLQPAERDADHVPQP